LIRLESGMGWVGGGGGGGQEGKNVRYMFV
jgi:hypothetical protein